jgi:hypothetical protein
LGIVDLKLAGRSKITAFSALGDIYACNFLTFKAFFDTLFATPLGLAAPDTLNITKQPDL